MADAGGTPGATIESVSATVPIVDYVGPGYTQVDSVTHSFLEANTAYWIGISSSGTNSVTWWATPDPAGKYAIEDLLYNYPLYVSQPGENFLLEVTGTPVPEPSLMVLLGISVLSLARLRRWWRE